MERSATSSAQTVAAPDGSGATLRLSTQEFSTLLERGQRPLYTFLCGLVGDDEQARDLMQDTFYEAWRAHLGNAPPFDVARTEAEARRWLFRVAYHRAVSALRRRRIVRWHSLDAVLGDEGTDMPVAAPFEERLVEDDAVREALAALAPADAACLTLVVVHGFTAAEAGQIIGASAQAIAKRYTRAKRRLRAVYLAQNQQAEERRSR